MVVITACSLSGIDFLSLVNHNYMQVHVMMTGFVSLYHEAYKESPPLRSVPVMVHV